MSVWSFVRDNINLRPGQRVRLRASVTAPPSTGTGLFNLTTRFGDYWEAFAVSSDIWIRHADTATPPFSCVCKVTSSGDASEPCLAVVPWRRCYLDYARANGNIYERTSDDEGLTFSSETLVWSGASHAGIVCSGTGTLLRSAYVGGNLKGTLQEPGQSAAGTAFTMKDDAGAALAVADDNYRIAWDVSGRWWLHVQISGEGTPSLWFSEDEGETWTRFANTFAGTHPGCAAGHDGTLMLWTYSSGTLSVVGLAPGELVPSTPPTPGTLTDDSAAAITVADSSASFARAWEGSARWDVLLQQAAATNVSTFWTADEGATATLF